MFRRTALLTASAAMVLGATSVAAATRQHAPVDGSNALAGQGTVFFLAGIAVIALAVVLLPEDQPASP